MGGDQPSAGSGPLSADVPIFHALLVPHRSLSKRGFNTLMVGLGIVSLVLGLGFVSSGAWPVVGFFGLDVLVLWLAFRASYRSGNAREEVRVSRTELLIRKVSHRGSVQEASYNPFWARLLVRRHEEIGVTGMAVTGRGAVTGKGAVTGEGSTTEIGAFLNPADRESFAGAFGRALAIARRG